MGVLDRFKRKKKAPKKEQKILDSNDATFHFNLGDTYLQKGMIEQAMTEFKRTIELNPEHALAHHDLGVAYDRKRHVDEAITEYERAIELSPNNALYYHNLGLTYCRKHWWNQAVAAYKHALELESNYVEAHFHLAGAYFGLKRFDLAWKHVRMAEKLGMSTAKVAQLVDLLRDVSREPSAKEFLNTEDARVKHQDTGLVNKGIREYLDDLHSFQVKTRYRVDFQDRVRFGVVNIDAGREKIQEIFNVFSRDNRCQGYQDPVAYGITIVTKRKLKGRPLLALTLYPYGSIKDGCHMIVSTINKYYLDLFEKLMRSFHVILRKV